MNSVLDRTIEIKRQSDLLNIVNYCIDNRKEVTEKVAESVKYICTNTNARISNIAEKIDAGGLAKGFWVSGRQIDRHLTVNITRIFSAENWIFRNKWDSLEPDGRYVSCEMFVCEIPLDDLTINLVAAIHRVNNEMVTIVVTCER